MVLKLHNILYFGSFSISTRAKSNYGIGIRGLAALLRLVIQLSQQ